MSKRKFEIMLDKLIGNSKVKDEVRKIIRFAEKSQDLPELDLNVAFVSNGDYGQRIIAKAIAKGLHEIGYLKNDNVVEWDLADTVIRGIDRDIIEEYCKKANGGVLYMPSAERINELSDAFLLYCGISSNEDNTIFMVNGSQNEIDEFKEHLFHDEVVPFTLKLKQFSRTELKKAFLSVLDSMKTKYELPFNVLDRILDLSIEYSKKNNFVLSYYFVCTVLSRILKNQALRTYNKDNNVITVEDLKDLGDLLRDEKYEAPATKQRKYENYKQELDKIYQEIKRCSNTKVKDLSENALKNTLEQSVVDINGNCTGFIITDTGLCLTCKHCIKEDPRNRLVRIKHYLQNGQIIETPLTYDVVFTSEDKDLALIYLRSEHEQIKNSIHYPYIPLEQYKNAYIEKLQKFISAGYPLGGEDYENLSIIKGEVATIHHQAKRLMGWANMLSLPGSSGSPLVSVNTGKAIGLFQGVKNTKQDNYQSDNVKCFLPIGDIWREIWKFFGIKNHLKREHKKV